VDKFEFFRCLLRAATALQRSEHVLHRELQDPGTTITAPDNSEVVRLVVIRWITTAQAVGHVECLGANFQPLPFCDLELS
jgi:hypothetical protein